MPDPARTTGDDEPVGAAPGRSPRRWPARTAVGVLVVAALVLGGTTAYLYRTSEAWELRSHQYEADSRSLGTELATTRQDLDGSRSELEAVRSQLATAQERIVALANEKAQVGDDREAQRLVADYQARVSDAAGRVASALDECVQAQDTLIDALGTPDLYDQVALDDFATQVADLCTAATEANDALQTELGQ